MIDNAKVQKKQIEFPNVCERCQQITGICEWRVTSRILLSSTQDTNKNTYDVTFYPGIIPYCFKRFSLWMNAKTMHL
jgi:hypothetical protein